MRVQTSARHSAFPARQPETLSCWSLTSWILAVTRMFLSGMNNLPCQRPSFPCCKLVRSCVPTSWLVVLLEAFLACSLAQATVPHRLLPHGAMRDDAVAARAAPLALDGSRRCRLRREQEKEPDHRALLLSSAD